MKALKAFFGVLIVTSAFALAGCGSGTEEVKTDPNAPPPATAPPAESGKAQGGVGAPSLKMDGSQ